MGVKPQALLNLTLELNQTHGGAAMMEAAEARNSGLTDEEIPETNANIAINILTNMINGLADTMIDFPKVGVNNAA